MERRGEVSEEVFRIPTFWETPQETQHWAMHTPGEEGGGGQHGEDRIGAQGCDDAAAGVAGRVRELKEGWTQGIDAMRVLVPGLGKRSARCIETHAGPVRASPAP